MATARFSGSSEEGSLMRRQSGSLTLGKSTGKLLATQGYVVGIEISGGGSCRAAVLADLDGQILHRARRPARESTSETVLSQIDEMLKEVTDPDRLLDRRILRVGVAVGGLVDAHRGIVRRLHHAQEWLDFPLQDYLANRLEVPCIIDTNANAAALAEIAYNSARGKEFENKRSELVALYVGLGRGIGGGLVVNGRIYHGASSSAGEIGHMLVKEHGPKCSCGGYGHLEGIASAQAIVRRMIGLSIEYPESEEAIRRVTDGRAERITVEQIFRLRAEGDKVAWQVLEEVELYLGIALANIIHMINPNMIILGGQVARAGDALLTPLQARIHDLCLDVASEPVRIVQGKLGPEANIVGALTLALQDL